MSLAKPLLLGETFENWRFWMNKVSQNVNTSEKVISKVKKTDWFLKVACWKCDTLVTDFRKFQDVLSETFTFDGLRSWGKTFRLWLKDTFWAHLQPGHFAAISYIHTWRYLQAYNPARTSGTKMIQTYGSYKAYKPISIEQSASQPGGPVGAGGFMSLQHTYSYNANCLGN